jgi:hypothetical protein
MLSWRTLLVVLLWSASWTASSADELDPLDADFLAYLAEFEGDEDDWTIVEPTTTTTNAAAKPADTKAQRPREKPAASTSTAKPKPPAEGSQK